MPSCVADEDEGDGVSNVRQKDVVVFHRGRVSTSRESDNGPCPWRLHHRQTVRSIATGQ